MNGSNPEQRNYEPFHILLDGRRVSDVEVSRHAKTRFNERICTGGREGTDPEFWLWQRLKQKRVKPYSDSWPDVYIIDEDALMVVRFVPAEAGGVAVPEKLIVVSFLGRVSENIELRDLSALTVEKRPPKKNGRRKRRRR